jgi:amino acid adenylation domain-containing protein
MNYSSEYNVLTFLYELQNKEVYIWLNNQEKIQIYSANKLSGTVLEKLKCHKSEVINILKTNNVYKKPSFPFIYRQKNINYTCPPSFAQESLLFIDKLEDDANAYNIPFLFKLNTQTKLHILKKAFEEIIKKHTILKSKYIFKNDIFLQKTIEDKFIIKEKNILSNEELHLELDQNFNTSFNLEHDFPIKITIFYLNNKIYISIVFHHIAFDGWSVNIFMKELEYLYTQLSKKNNLKIPETGIKYFDFALWQHCYFNGEKLKQQLSYWNNKIKNHELLNFPIDKQRPIEFDYKGNSYFFAIEKKLSYGLKQLAKEKNTTLYNIMLTAFYILLNKYTQQNDLIVGTTTAGRHFKQIENVMGMFVNTLPLRLKFNKNISLKTLLENVSTLVIDAQENQDVPFEKIVENLQIEKDISRNPIFQMVFSTQNFKSECNLLKSLSAGTYIKTAKHDLTLSFDDSAEDTIKTEINYATSLFHPETIERISGHYINILKAVVDNIEQPINKIQTLPDDDFNTIIYDWNKTNTPYPSDKTICKLFEENAARSPQKTALIYKKISLTYRELNEASNKVAHQIRENYKKQHNKEIPKDSLIAIYSERNEKMIIGILGIIKSGTGYVPINPNEPIDRLALKIDDCKCCMLLTSSTLKRNLSSRIIQENNILTLNSILNRDDTNISNPKSINYSNSLAYTIYTSGSTGIPKGVTIEHKNLVNLIYTIINRHEQYKISTPKILSLTNYDFDIFGLELWGSLLSSGTLLLIDNHTKTTPTLLTEFINKTKPDMIQGTPALLSTILFDDLGEILNTLIIVGGEAIHLNIAQKLCNISNDVWNYYGPTETTIWSTSYKLNNSEKVLIGKALPNQKCFILDNELNPVPIGVPGELHIGGEGVSRGYLNNAKLTETVFIDNPYSSKPEKIYKTGDIACWHPDANIEFLGRRDNQIKLRGHRVEPDEIENILSIHPKINQCIIRLCERKDLKEKVNKVHLNFHSELLIAYYTLKETCDGINFLNEELRKFLSEKLPDYMVPNLFVQLEKIPLNTSGKIDFKSLPIPTLSAINYNYTKPETKTESMICKIWENILGIDKVGTTDNFFNLGGTSMLAIRVTHDIGSALNKHIPIAEIFLKPTIQQIAEYINTETEKDQDNENWEF